MTGTTLLACGDPKDASLCTAFDEYLNARTTVQAIEAADPTDLDAAQATDIGENYLAAVRRLRQADDGRYGQQLYNLENAVDDILRTLATTQDAADIDTWRPLIEEDLDDAEEAADQVVAAIEPSCSPDTSGN